MKTALLILAAIIVFAAIVALNSWIERKEMRLARERLLRDRAARGENDQWVNQ